MHPGLSDLYRTKIGNLALALQHPDLKMEALRGLISEIRLAPDRDAPGGHAIELAGEFSGVFAMEDAQTPKPALLARAWF